MNRLAVYSYLTRYTHGKTIELASCSQNPCQKTLSLLTGTVRQYTHGQTDNMQFLVWLVHRTFARQLNLDFYLIEPEGSFPNGTALAHPTLTSFPADDDKDANEDRELC